jgi:hypothetical protein
MKVGSESQKIRWVVKLSKTSPSSFDDAIFFTRDSFVLALAIDDEI